VAGAMFIAPATAFFTLFLLFPVIAVVLLAFTNWTGFNLSQIAWGGVGNFKTLANDAVLTQALIHTVIFVVATTVVLNLVGLPVALLINTKVIGHDFLRIAMFLPLGLSPVLTAILWQEVLGPYGLINELVVHTLHLTSTPIGFLGNPHLALITVLLASVWQYTGYNMLLYYAGLQSLPKERLEAAAIDGAGALRRLRYVTLPYLRPVIAVVVVLNLIGGWKVFDLIYVLTGGGPNHSTEVLSTYLYEQAFTLNRVGYASSIAVAIIALATVSALMRGRLAGEAT
jgi:raffinose/stachyose/melibiose transport system permease protein